MAETPTMTSSRPYLIRALHEWIVDNGMTPLILVDATAEGVEVPQAFVDNGKIILNVSMTAVQGLELGDALISFKGRFSGAVQHVVVPVSAVQAIYARETSAGMMFPEEEEQETGAPAGEDTASDSEDTASESDTSSSRPHLRVIK